MSRRAKRGSALRGISPRAPFPFAFGPSPFAALTPRLLHKRREQGPHRRISLREGLRVPLDAEQEVPVGRLDPLDQAVGRERVGTEALGEALDPLVVHAVDPDGRGLEQAAEPGVGGDPDVVHQEIAGVRALAAGSSRA